MDEVIDQIIKFGDDSLINMIMVYKGLRPSSLIEPAGYQGKNDILIEILRVVNGSGLITTKDRIGRILVTKKKLPSNIDINTDEGMGKILGFHCYKNNLYKDKNNVNVSIDVTINKKKIQLYAEKCDAKINNVKLLKHVSTLVDKYKSILIGYNVTYKLTYSPSISFIKKAIVEKDYDFIQKNSDYIANYFTNLTGDEIIYRDMIVDIKKYINVFQFILEKEKDISFLFPPFNGKNYKQIERVTGKITEFIKNFNNKTKEKDFKEVEKSVYSTKTSPRQSIVKNKTSV